MQRRIDPSDILQEVYLEADRRLDDYSRRRPCGFFVWLRLITGEKLEAFQKELSVGASQIKKAFTKLFHSGAPVR